MWELLENHPEYVDRIFWFIGVLGIALIGAIVFLLTRTNMVWKWYKEARNATDLESYSKVIQGKLKKNAHTIAFTADQRDDHDNMKDYKDFSTIFCKDRSVLVLSESDIGKFDEKFAEHKVIVYKVMDNEAPSAAGKRPLYWELANYCCNNEKNCVLLTSKHCALDGLNNFYITTVNYYSKLRETLHNLLFFAP